MHYAFNLVSAGLCLRRLGQRAPAPRHNQPQISQVYPSRSTVSYVAVFLAPESSSRPQMSSWRAPWITWLRRWHIATSRDTHCTENHQAASATG
jgi:hypothetical protein